MTLRCPSFSAAATRAVMPPETEEREETVAQFTELELAGELELVAELVLLGALELVLELLLHPATSRIDPTAATLVATIALDARKVKPSHAAPGVLRACVWHLG